MAYLAVYPIRSLRHGRVIECEAPQTIAHPLPVNLVETEDGYLLHVLVPGLKAEDIHLDVVDNVVTLEAHFSGEEREYLLQELPRGTFRRTLRFPVPLEASKVEAHLTDGVLTVQLPKADSLRPKTIRVIAK